MTVKLFSMAALDANTTDLQELIDRYEGGETRRVRRHLPKGSLYRRNYISPEDKPELGHLAEKTDKLPFDLISEMRFEDERSLSQFLHEVTPSEISDGSPPIVNNSDIFCLTVDEFVTDQSMLQPRPASQFGEPAIKQICFMKRRQGMSRDDFINYYEQKHSDLAMRILLLNQSPVFAGYKRNYPNSVYFQSSGENNVFGYDVISEFWYWSVEDYHHFLQLCTEPGIGAALARDELQFFDRTSIKLVNVVERAS